ncbi:restriction endonuclease subunit S [Fusobacterium sp. SYSU M8D902]|uniref:restriction endonuclease subunit S n=1 Tax=Fusobacterium sp. SYSU M8D902 TaxID=3159562 RepID=UPI0032E3F013
MGKKHIETVKDFQTSINIALDLYDDRKIENFIPTVSAIKIIEEILLSTNINSTQRAKMLVGAYGRGKSHIVLVALSVLFKKNKEIFARVLEKIKSYNKDMYEFISSYIESDRKILPIVISGNGSTLSQSFLLGLQQTLKNEDLEELIPDTNYSAVIATIENWKDNYPETYEKLKEKLEQPITNFILKIKEYDFESYKRFELIYPQLTSGSSFNPFNGIDIVDLYEKVAIKLKEKGYLGIYVVYDEFSKYLEGNIENTGNNEVKLLQDFAEKCNRSGSLQLHLLLISHKELSNYFSKNLTKEKIDAWTGVSGRFKEILVQDNFEQTYDVISQVIKKDEKYWKKFQIKYKDNFEILQESTTITEGLNVGREDRENIIKGCYPLHPISTFILPRISEKIAQNERTLFTFLSAEQKYTLNSYLKTYDEDKFKIITPDYIFDYFDPLLKKENYNSDIYKTYKLLKTVLVKVEENSLESKILKTIALIYFIEQFERIAPTRDTIIEIYKSEYSVETIIEVLKKLQEKECIVYLKLSNNYLKIKESSGVDIENEIIRYREKHLTKIPYIDLLNNLPFDNFLYPTRYNDENEIMRYFNFVFIKSGDIYSKRYLEIRDEFSDGVVFGVIPASQDNIEDLQEKLKSEIKDEQMIFILPKKYKNISSLIYRYKSIEELKRLAQDDSVLRDEYELIQNDLQEVIFNYIDSFVRPERLEVEYYYLGEKRGIYRKAHLSNLLSDICEKIFYKTPLINNETINKNIISTATLNSRNKIVRKLLDNVLEENLSLRGTGQEVTIVRSLLLNKGILKKNIYDNLEINLDIEDEKLKNILKIIDGFLSKEIISNWRNFKELYDRLLLPENNIGIKRGVIPIYLALLIHKYKKFLIIKNNEVEEKIDVELLNKINENPESYSVYIEDWNEEKGNYLTELTKIFDEYTVGDNGGLNNFKYQVGSMKQWYLSLPKYSKETISEYVGEDQYQEIERVKKEFLNSLKLEIDNPREYIFEKLMNIYGYNKLDLDILQDIKRTKVYFEGLLEKLKLRLIEDVKKIFSKNSDQSLISIMKNWEEELNEKTKEHIFNKNESRVLELIRSSKNNEIVFIEKIARMLTSLRVEDWNNSIIIKFLQEVKEFKITVEEFNSNSLNKEEGKNNSYKITFVNENGNEQAKTFDKVEYTRRASLLYNDLLSSIDEMGESISQQEIRQILIEILEKFC